MKKKIVLSILLALQVIIVNLLSFFPEFVESYYSNGLYPYIAKTSRAVFGLLGFSVGDIIYGVAIVLALRWLWKRRKTWKKEYKYNLLTMLATLSVGYFLFYFLWAVNYHRVPLNEKMSIEKKYKTHELVAFTKRLIVKVNEAHGNVAENDSAKVTIPYSADEIYGRSLNGYEQLEKKYSFFGYKRESLKSSLISLPLSYMGFGGYLNPFTNEAQVNNRIPKYNMPTTACHEMAHQIGYASESEANFIGYMASISSDDAYFQYSGYTFALKYCLRNINKLDKEQGERLLPLINPGVLQNFEESEQFNEKYSSFIEVIFEAFYDNFLKLNHQEDGLDTYSKFVGLLVNYYENKEL